MGVEKLNGNGENFAVVRSKINNNFTGMAEFVKIFNESTLSCKRDMDGKLIMVDKTIELGELVKIEGDDRINWIDKINATTKESPLKIGSVDFEINLDGVQPVIPINFSCDITANANRSQSVRLNVMLEFRVGGTDLTTDENVDWVSFSYYYETESCEFGLTLSEDVCRRFYYLYEGTLPVSLSLYAYKGESDRWGTSASKSEPIIFDNLQVVYKLAERESIEI